LFSISTLIGLSALANLSPTFPCSVLDTHKKGALKEPLLLHPITEVTFKVAALVKRAAVRFLEIVDETCIDGTTHRNLKTTD
jgi:hypothetical protein